MLRVVMTSPLLLGMLLGELQARASELYFTNWLSEGGIYRVDLNTMEVDPLITSGLLGGYGITEGATYQDGDLDGDGDVDLADLAEMLGLYGTVCE